MENQKTLQIIESIKNMTDKEADALEIFITGFRAGIQTVKDEIYKQQSCKPSTDHTA